MTLITYGGRPVAMAGRECFCLAPQIAQRPDGDPVKTFVCFLVLYARDVLTGQLPGEPRRYLPARAERYARECRFPFGDADAAFFATWDFLPASRASVAPFSAWVRTREKEACRRAVTV